ncbi:MAG: hypothetical protein GWO81_00425 [Verrucomicrobia bacterium]|nr:hypothetical protein [Verrucomicrobiota bacterium]
MIAKKIALGLGIAMILPMMIHFGVGSFVSCPQWQDYQIENYYEQHERSDAEAQKELEAEQLELDHAFEAQEIHFQWVLFYIAVPLGLLALFIGAFTELKGVGAGLMFGGIFSICNGYANNWDYLDDRLIFISLVVAFILLLGLAYKKIERYK